MTDLTAAMVLTFGTAIAAGLSLALGLYAILAARAGRRDLFDRVTGGGRTGSSGPAGTAPDWTGGAAWALLRQWAQAIGAWVGRLLPVQWILVTRRRLQSAGMRASLEQFLGAWAMAILAWYLVVSVASVVVHLPAWLTIGALVFVLFLPVLHLSHREAERLRRIGKAFPFFIDFVTMAVEAGSSLDAALLRASQKVRGPLGDEAQRYVQNISRGLTRRDALLAYADALGLPEVQDFVQVLLQSGNLGLPLAGVLRAQSQVLRENRRLQAEEAAQKLPLKLLFPLVVFIFPTIFLLILGPAAILFLEQWG